MDIIYRYDEKKNPGNQQIVGVPRRDLTAADWARLSDMKQRQVAACPFYVKARPPKESKD